MARPSSFQSLGGPLGDTRLEFGSGDLLLGSDADCQIRIAAPGVAARHAQLVITKAGASIQRLDGPVGINDDLVTTEATLRSGDFVWIGEPGGDASIMLQFTLGDVEEISSPPPPVVRTILPPVEFSEAEPMDDDLAVVAEETAMVEELTVAPEGSEDVVEEVVEELVVEEPLDQTIALTSASEPAEMSDSDSVAQDADLLQLDEADLPPGNDLETPEEAPASAGVEVAELEPVVEPELEPESDVEPEPVELETQPEVLDLDVPPPEILEADPVDLDDLADVEAEFQDPLGELAALPPPAPATPSVPPAPWQVPASTPVAQESPTEYASAWESPAPTVALPSEPAAPSVGPAPGSEPAPPPPPPPPAAAVPAPPPQPRPAPAPAPKPKVRSAEQDAALRTPPPARPPARTTSSTSAIMGGLAVVLLLGGAALFSLREAPAPVVPMATPTPVPLATAVVAPQGPAGPAAVTDPIPPAPTPVQAGAAPATASTPPPRATPPPSRAAATPPPAPTRSTAPAGAAQPPPAAAPAPAAQVPRLLEEGRSAAETGDLSKASQLFDQVLKMQPGNPEATSRKADVDARLAALAKKFSVSGTTVIGGKAAKGPTGFDLGGGGAVQREYSAQIRCTSTPASVEPGKAYSVNCSILNVGTKAFKLAAVTINEAADGARSTAAGVVPRQDIAPQSSAVILERSGTWTAKSQWSLDVLVKSNKDESFRAIYSWR